MARRYGLICAGWCGASGGTGRTHALLSAVTDGVDGLNGISVPQYGSQEPVEKKPPAVSITMIGLDSAKSVFQVHGVNETGKVEIKRKLRRSELIPFFERLEACTVVMEACSAAHHWARILSSLGHKVKLIAPEAGSQTIRQKGQEERPSRRSSTLRSRITA